MADPRFEAFLKTLMIENEQIDLSKPTATRSGRYWYNLHLVLVTQDRFRIGDHGPLTKIREWCQKIAERKGHLISRFAILPDHLHMAIRGGVEQSPQEIALGYMNNLAYALGQVAIWQFGYYVGTFSEYDMNAVREKESP